MLVVRMFKPGQHAPAGQQGAEGWSPGHTGPRVTFKVIIGLRRSG